MTTNPTLLQLLAINDETAPALTTDLVEVVKVDDGEGNEVDRMSHWLQHVHLLGTKKVPAFELLFIDIRFHEDRYAPKYGRGKVNPMGLLHALTFAARQDPRHSPFVWGYHSGDPASVKNDPVAIIVFSLLSALEQRGETTEVKVGGRPWKWNDVGIHNLNLWYDPKGKPNGAVRHFSNAIANLPKGGSEVIWKEMVRRYRQKVLDYVYNERMFVDPDQVGMMLRQAQRGSEEDRQQLAGATLDFYGPPARPWTRKILLQSLFADELIDQGSVWPIGKRQELTMFLTTFRQMGRSRGTDDWFGMVKECMAKIESGTRILKNIPMKDRRCVGALAIICWWLERISSGTTYKAKDLLEAFGYNNDDRRVVEGCLASLGYDSLSEFFEYLKTTNVRLPPPFASVGRKWWTETCKKKGEDGPRCIQFPADRTRP